MISAAASEHICTFCFLLMKFHPFDFRAVKLSSSVKLCCFFSFIFVCFWLLYILLSFAVLYNYVFVKDLLHAAYDVRNFNLRLQKFVVNTLNYQKSLASYT